MKKVMIILSMLLSSMLMGCLAPESFVRTMEPGWQSIEIRSDVEYDDAWETVQDILIRRFDLEVINKSSGYMRTGWLYSWTGHMNERYRVRVTINFNATRDICEVKSEAEWGGSGRWIMGYDARLLSTLQSDIMGAIGRTTR